VMSLARTQLLIRLACANCQQAERDKTAIAKISAGRGAEENRNHRS